QLAVLTDARGLDTAAMQRIAAEFGYAESTFVFPPKDPANTAQVRIFTPAREMPFAGHPNVGTAFVLGAKTEIFGKAVGTTLLFEEGAGLVSIEIIRAGGQVSNALVTAPQALKRLGDADVKTIAACLGLGAEDIFTAIHPPTAASVGMPFVFVELRDSACVVRANPDLAQFRAHFPVHGADGVMIYARTGASSLHARMFAPNLGVGEDAATGSAGAALTALRASLDPAVDLDLKLDIHQGAEMGRPSLMKGEAAKRKGQVTAARIGGPCAAVMKGRIQLD
ncbi:MAG: PhzF family phenazine biosynthesis protein, partial [Rhodospirillaceae bacterium]